MSFLVRIVIAILILFILEIIFYKKLINSQKAFLGNRFQLLQRWAPRVYLIFINIFPGLLLLYWSYSYIFSLNESIRIENVFFDYLVIYPFWTLALLTVQTFILFIPLDILKFLVRTVLKSKREQVKTFSLRVNFLLILFFVFYVPIRILVDYNMVSVRVTEFQKENLPENLQGFKIALIADIQADRYTDDSRLSNYISKVNETEPDLILIAGDLITSTPNYISTSAEFLSRLNANYGIYSCIGDHDNWAYRHDIERSRRELKAALDSVNVNLIHNSNDSVEVGESKIGITFITHTYSERINDVKLDSLASNCVNCDLKIFLTHQSRQFLINKAIEYDYDLYLAGHTHGGQLSLLFPFINLSPTLFETKYVRGDFFFDDMMVTINRGLGMSIAPVRYNSTPEVTLIVLGNKGIK